MTNLKTEKIAPFGLTMIVVGACIGSGIFLTPSTVAITIDNSFYILLAWLIGGCVALTGALSFSELAGLFPKAGGVYVYLKECYGKRVAFLYGWSILTVITSGSIAALVIVSVDYFNQLIGGVLSSVAQLSLAVLMIFFNATIHVLGIKVGERFVTVLSLLKVIGVIGLVLVGLLFYQELPVKELLYTEGERSSIWILIGASMIPILWSFGGFQHASFLAGDALNPKKSVPIAMISGVLLVTLLYIAVNIAYISVLGLDGLSVSQKPAVDMLNAIWDNSGVVVLVLIVVSTFGSAFIFTMSAPRIYYAMAKDEVFFSWMAKKHKRYNTPANAIISQSVWSSVLVLFWGTFERLINYVTFIEWVFLLLAAVSVFYFRRKIPKEKYTFRSPFFPILPILFSIAVVGFLSVEILAKNTPALYGLILLVLGMIVYEVFKNRAQRNSR